MPRAGPSRSQRQPSQTQTQRYGRSQRHHEDEDDAEEILAENYEDDDGPGMEDTNTVRAALIATFLTYSCRFNLIRVYFNRT
jgi:hypothetical protein